MPGLRWCSVVDCGNWEKIYTVSDIGEWTEWQPCDEQLPTPPGILPTYKLLLETSGYWETETGDNWVQEN